LVVFAVGFLLVFGFLVECDCFVLDSFEVVAQFADFVLFIFGFKFVPAYFVYLLGDGKFEFEDLLLAVVEFGLVFCFLF
jgi:hypothetical protein